MEWLRERAAEFSEPHLSVVEVGSRNVNGAARDAFPPSVRWWGSDIAPGPGVDAVCDGALIEPPFTPDVVVCCEVFEHTPTWPRIIARSHTVLREGGILLVTMATTGRAPHSAHDGGAVRAGEYYANVTPVELATWLGDAGFSHVALWLDEKAGDLRARAVKGAQR